MLKRNWHNILLSAAILILLYFVISPRIIPPRHGPAVDERRDRLRIKGLESAIKGYALDVGSPPSTQHGLKALLKRPNDVDSIIWDGPYIDGNEVPRDSWGRPFEYEFPTEKRSVDFALWSLGEDGVDGTKDDIVNWNEIVESSYADPNDGWP